MTGQLIVIAALSLGWHILLTRWIVKAKRRALDSLPTLDQQLRNLERMDAHIQIVNASIEKLADLDRSRAADVSAIEMLRNFRNN
jgi:Tfp pilus assembly protein PilN